MFKKESVHDLGVALSAILLIAIGQKKKRKRRKTDGHSIWQCIIDSVLSQTLRNNKSINNGYLQISNWRLQFKCHEPLMLIYKSVFNLCQSKSDDVLYHLIWNHLVNLNQTEMVLFQICIWEPRLLIDWDICISFLINPITKLDKTW